MAYLKGTERERFIRKTFAEIAPRYVFMNHLMSGGMDIMLRREMARLTRPQAEECLLDLGSGTGDLANEILRKFPSVNITAADFSLEMMTATDNWQDIKRAAADALHLPFADASFDLVTSGYLVRNVSDLDTALSEQFRVLKP
ncbi:MAG TPA: class I SAM-dependent methyltransferase, partial [Anaerolineaceae bacterium]|nr:class I SAM-dependent methyltransferase [Anaerolineaceae bacterium]